MDIIENLSEELGEKEERIMELEKKLEEEKKEKKKYYLEHIVLQKVGKFLCAPELRQFCSVLETMDYFDDQFNDFGDDKYNMYILALETSLGIDRNELYDEDEIREAYQETPGFPDITDDVDEMVDFLEEQTGDCFHELNVDKPDGKRVWYNLK